MDLTFSRRHGKFRPTLMKLVSSNDPAFVRDTVQEALKTYRKTSDVSSALDILIKLKGIGPATASLLLAVHDSDNVIFFGDEAFYWLCCHGKTSPIKYNMKEYQALRDSSRELVKRLGVRAVDVERVAYALMRGQEPGPVEVKQGPKSQAVKKSSTKHAGDSSAKRKENSIVDAGTPAPARRSKRAKRA